MDLFSLLYYNTVDRKKHNYFYDKVKKNWPPTHTIYFYATQGILCVQNSNSKQSATALIVSMKKALHGQFVCVWLCNIHLLSRAGIYFNSPEAWMVEISSSLLRNANST